MVPSLDSLEIGAVVPMVRLPIGNWDLWSSTSNVSLQMMMPPNGVAETYPHPTYAEDNRIQVPPGQMGTGALHVAGGDPIPAHNPHVVDVVIGPK
ncbi:unnamed protein product [Clonostachys solani]|uniref:Uncharacterized protein n=1 Tax=Clonostachys solani TaxID=160281 RepID=A0A9P0EAV2_9HYPO|nr:unnamed protein product [Clonostachys solani]